MSDLEGLMLDASGPRRIAALTILRSSIGSAVAEASFKALAACPGSRDLPPTVVQIESSVHVHAGIGKIRRIESLQVHEGAPIPDTLAQCLIDRMRGFLPITVDPKHIPPDLDFAGNTFFPVTLKNAVQCAPGSSKTCGP
jgi:hypothetical protein